MGTYINTGNAGFQSARNSEYVDKSGLISVVNRTLFTKSRFSCVTRCRRFGKSMAAEMLCAYYDHSCDSRSLFADLQIAADPTFEQHLNKYAVIYLDMTNFVTRYKDDGIVEQINAALLADVSKAYSDIPTEEGDDLMDYLLRVVEAKQEQFVFIIDEWDAICREFAPETQAMDRYVNWLRHQGVRRCLHDGYPAHQEIQDGVGTEQFSGVFDGGTPAHGRLLRFQKRRGEDAGRKVRYGFR